MPSKAPEPSLRLSTKTLAANEREWTALSELIGRIYECAIDPGQWDDTLAQMVALIGPPEWDVAFLIWERLSPPRCRFIGAAGVSPMAREVYVSTFAGRHPWSRKIFPLPIGSVVDTDDIMPRSELIEHAIYKNFLGAWGIERAVAAVLDRRGSEALALLMPGKPQRELEGLKRGLRLIAPHLQRAARISRTLGEASLREGAAQAALERAPTAIVALTPGLEIVTANGKAQALAESGVIRTAGGRFAFSDGRAQACLVQLAATAPPASAAFKTRGPRELSVLAARLPTQTMRTLDGVVEGAGLVVSIGVDGGAPLLEIDRLGAWFGLTPSEARLVAALAGGDNLQDYAARRNVSMNAVRFLLKGVYRKTGVDSQARLIARIRDLPLS